MERRHYAYAGSRVASELPIPEWAAFERPEPFDDPDVLIALGEPLNPVPDPSLRGAESATKQSRVPELEIASSRDPSTPLRSPAHLAGQAAQDGLLARTPSITADEFRFHIPEAGDYYVHHGREIVVTPAPDAGMREVRLFLLGTAWGALCYQRGVLVLHSSVVQTGDGAIAFCGGTGSGKSSAAAWLVARGFRLVGDDLCRFDVAAGEARVYPAPPRLKLWREALGEMGWSADGLERDHFRLDKFHLPVRGSEASRFTTRDASLLPLQAIYLLEWGETGLTRLTGVTGLRRLVESATYRGELLEPMGRLGEHWERCAEIARHVPIFQFERPRAWSASNGAMGALVEHAQNFLTIPRNGVILSARKDSMTNTTPIQPATTFRRTKDIPFSQLDDELLAVDAAAGYCYSLNETAGRVWDLIATPLSLDAICAQLRREFAVDEQTCQSEVVALLEGLREAGLAQVNDAKSG
jgi:Coenzyme PQQ synthesis protein D (PqqD)